MVGGRKIGGSAQKRSKDFIFQHGSIPISLDMERANSFMRSKYDMASLDGVTCLEELLDSNIGAAFPPIYSLNLLPILSDWTYSVPFFTSRKR